MTSSKANSGNALSQPSPAEFVFDQYETVTGSATHQTVMNGFFLGGAMADLAVVNITENKDRRLRMYTFDESEWVLKLDVRLRPEVLFVDVARIAGIDRLIIYESGRLNWFDPESSTEHLLVKANSNFNPPRENELPHVDITRDVNGDGLDDLVVPDVDGFRVFIQLEGSLFADPVKIGPSTDMSRIYGADGYRYDPWSQSRIHSLDYDQNGRIDLVFWNEDHFEVHLQDKHGQFTTPAKTFTTDVAFDSDNLNMLNAGDMQGRVLHTVADLNHDGIGDLVINSLQGGSITDKRSAYEVYFGAKASDGGTVFTSDAGIIFQSKDRIMLGMARHGFDGDGKLDLMLTTIDVKYLEGSLWKRIKGAMGDDIWLELQFYQAQDGGYLDQPNATRRIALDGVPSHTEPGWIPLDIVLRGATHEKRRTQETWPRAFNLILHTGDVNGDGRSDLLIGKNTPNGVDVFVGVPGPELLSKQPQDMAATAPESAENTWLVAAPNDEEYTWLADINKDGKQDILMHHPFTLRDAHGAPKLPPGSEPHRITILIAR